MNEMEHRDDKMHPDYTRCLVSELDLVLQQTSKPPRLQCDEL